MNLLNTSCAKINRPLPLLSILFRWEVVLNSRTIHVFTTIYTQHTFLFTRSELIIIYVLHFQIVETEVRHTMNVCRNRTVHVLHEVIFREVAEEITRN